MNKELIINYNSKSGTEIALLENSFLTEFHRDNAKNDFQVGDIFLGKVKKIMPGLNAAFVNVGHKKDAFLHYTDLSPNIKTLNKYVWNALENPSIDHTLNNIKFEPQILKTGQMPQVLAKKKPIMVQVLKEPISTKGPRLTCEITLAGTYLILSPFNHNLSISKKISEGDERKRLFKLVESIKPKNFGVIVRTNAKGKKVSELHKDLNELLLKWKNIQKEIRGAVAPQKIYIELNKTSSLLRGMLNNDFAKIHVNDKFLGADLKEYIKGIDAGAEKKISIYNGKRPIFDNFNITKQIKQSFGKNVTMKSGAYLVIEHTEAMHVIDVNSGYKVNDQSNQEAQALNVNLESAAEIARQLRLRDIGGLIIIDFIDMKLSENKKTLHRRMKEAMQNDSSKHTILTLSRFGLMQITRQRAKPEVKIKTDELCPSCDGSGKIKPSILITDEIVENFKYLVNVMSMRNLRLETHDFVYAHLKKGGFLRSLQWKWFFKYKSWLKLRSNEDFALTQYSFLDGMDDEIDLNS